LRPVACRSCHQSGGLETGASRTQTRRFAPRTMTRPSRLSRAVNHAVRRLPRIENDTAKFEKTLLRRARVPERTPSNGGPSCPPCVQLPNSLPTALARRLILTGGSSPAPPPLETSNSVRCQVTHSAPSASKHLRAAASSRGARRFAHVVCASPSMTRSLRTSIIAVGNPLASPCRSRVW
jgi:hypothetical protein